jgi:Family of unknown function (DUF5683)
MKYLLMTALAGLMTVCAQRTDAQTNSADTTERGVADSVVKPHVFQPNPKKAGLYSAILPGLGQAYNHNYWKIPVIYAGIGVAGYFIADNLNNYQSYRQAYIGRINNPNPTDKYVGIYTTDQLQQLQNDYNKYLDITVLISSLGYVLQIMDAVTSAHLKNFDISRDISLHVLPTPTPVGPGIGLVVRF